jgi:diamine N-acetyltransferase
VRFVHQLDNNASVMRYWFEEPYEAFVELSDLYDKHIHDQSERRFVVECEGEKAGLVELVEINHVHRRAEFQIIISPEHQGKVSPHGGKAGDGLRVQRIESLQALSDCG